MKLFTKEIDKKLFDQFSKGNDLKNQMVVAKIFNPYGRGTWYIINSDPDDPDYLWAIVDLIEVEVGSVSRSELESIKVPPFRLGLERDMYFEPKNAQEVYLGLMAGEKYAKGGEINIEAQNKDMLLNYAEELEHHVKEFEQAAKKAEKVMPWVIAKIERASTDLADVTHYLASQNAIREEEEAGEEIDDFDRGGEIKSFDVIYFKELTSRDGSKQKVIRDRAVREGSLEKVLSKAYAGFYPNDVTAEIRDKSTQSTVARITPDGKGKVIADGYGLNVGDIELEQEVEEVEDKPKKKLFGLFAKGGKVSDSFYKEVGAESKNDFFDKIYGNRKLYQKAETKLNVDRINKTINYKEPLFSDTMTVLFSLYYSNDEQYIGIKDGISRKAFFENAIETFYGQKSKGGKVTFDDKVQAVKKSLLKRKKVSPKVQKDYGKTYSPKEAEQSAKRIVGAMTAKERLMKTVKKVK